MAKTLADRIASAKSSTRVRSADLEALIVGLKAEEARLTGEFERHSAESVDFAFGEPDRDLAAAAADRARRTLQGLRIEIIAIEGKLAERRDSEDAERTASLRKVVIEERDALAATISDRYHRAVAELIALAKDIKASDERLIEAGLARELSAEAIARGCNNTFRFQMEAVTRLTEIRLPSLDAYGDMWPPREPNLAWAFEPPKVQKPLTPEQEEERHRQIWGFYSLQNPLLDPVDYASRTGPRWVGRDRQVVEIMHIEADRLRGFRGVMVEAIDPANVAAELRRTRAAVR